METTLKELLELLRNYQYENKSALGAALKIYDDESGHLEDYDTEEIIYNFNDINDLMKELRKHEL